MATNMSFLEKIWKMFSGQRDEGEPGYTFPKTVEDFGYCFNQQGQLKNIRTGKAFEFAVRNKQYNHKRYEALAQLVIEYVYELMENDAKLKRVNVPVDATQGEPHSFIFMSEDALTNQKLIVLINGGGPVRAGLWSRRLAVNDCLNSGTQLPFIKKGQEEGYGIIVMNQNLNFVEQNNADTPIRENSSPDKHVKYVWKHFVSKAAAGSVAIVAHSSGGFHVLSLAKKFVTDFKRRVFGIAFTNFHHTFRNQDAESQAINFLKDRSINFVASSDPKNTPQRKSSGDCPAVSAGTVEHEMTSWKSFDLVFNFFQTKLSTWKLGQTMESLRVDGKPQKEEKDYSLYKMDARPTGICVILNNKFFDREHLSVREGTDIDAEHLASVFKDFHFIIERYDNKTDDQMVTVLENIASWNHSQFDCFVCCILSHGNQGVVCGSNGHPVEIADLTGKFKAKACPSLAGKPKLFFIQACQGTSEQEGFEVERDSIVVSPTLMVKEVIPNDADFLLAYSTAPGFISYRNRQSGSWYISKLVEMLRKHGKKEDILHILLLVNHEVGKMNTVSNGVYLKQLPRPEFTLRKKVVFQ